MSLREKLEKLHTLIINEEHEKADALFHEAFVESARSVHKQFMDEEDWMSEDVFDEDDVDEATDEIENEEMFAEDGDEDYADDEEMDAGDDLEGEMDYDEEGMDDEEMDYEEGEEAEGDIEDRVEDLEADIERLTSEFEALMNTEEGEHDEDLDGDGDIAGDEMGDDMDYEDDEEVEEGMDGHGYGAGPSNDGHAGSGSKPGDRRKMPKGASHKNDDRDGVYEDEEVDESADTDELEEAFDELDESFELEDVKNENSEDLIGTGGKESFSPHAPDQTNLPKKGANTLDAKAHHIGDGPDHKGYAREDAPTTSKMKARKNVRGKSMDDTSSVSKEGDSSAALNKDYAGNKPFTKAPVNQAKTVTEGKKTAKKTAKKSPRRRAAKK